MTSGSAAGEVRRRGRPWKCTWLPTGRGSTSRAESRRTPRCTGSERCRRRVPRVRPDASRVGGRPSWGWAVSLASPSPTAWRPPVLPAACRARADRPATALREPGSGHTAAANGGRPAPPAAWCSRGRGSAPGWSRRTPPLHRHRDHRRRSGPKPLAQSPSCPARRRHCRRLLSEVIAGFLQELAHDVHDSSRAMSSSLLVMTGPSGSAGHARPPLGSRRGAGRAARAAPVRSRRSRAAAASPCRVSTTRAAAVTRSRVRCSQAWATWSGRQAAASGRVAR